MGQALEELERPRADAAKKSGKSADGQAGGRGNKKPPENFTEGLSTREKVGAAIGMSGIRPSRPVRVVDSESFGVTAGKGRQKEKGNDCPNSLTELAAELGGRVGKLRRKQPNLTRTP